MKFKLLLILPLAFSTILSVPALASPKVDEFGDKIETSKPSIDMNKYPIIASGDWRSAKPQIPWSTPVVVRDDFEGDYLAVFDRNYQGGGILSDRETGITSNWSRRHLRIYAYDRVTICSFLCKSVESTRETNSVSIKAGSKVFHLEGKNGNFAISEEVAAALREAPSGETKIKVKFEGSGVDVVNNIGEKTVYAWKTVYQDAQVAESEDADTSASDQPVSGKPQATAPKKQTSKKP